MALVENAKKAALKKYNGEFSLEKYIEFYIETALRIAEKGPNLSEFESELVNNVSSRFGMDEGDVRYLANFFYWQFRSKNSPLEFAEEKYQITREEYKLELDKCKSDRRKEADFLSKLSRESTFVRLNNNFKGIREFIDFILEKYVRNPIHNKAKKPYLVARLENLNGRKEYFMEYDI